MSKYDILETKLTNISKYLDKVNIDDESTAEYLRYFKEYVIKLIEAVHKRNIRNSDGAVLGLVRAISDYDELCADKILWSLVIEADLYYSKECKIFS